MKKTTSKRKKKFKLPSKLGLYVGFSILLCIIYTVVDLYIFSVCGSEPDTLTMCFFGFFGGEIVTAAFIKISNIKVEGNADNNFYTTESEEKPNE